MHARTIAVLVAVLPIGCGKPTATPEQAKPKAEVIEAAAAQRESELEEIKRQADAAKARLRRARDVMTAWIDANSEIEVANATISSSDERKRRIVAIREATVATCGVPELEATREFETAVAEMKAVKDAQLRWMERNVKKPE